MATCKVKDVACSDDPTENNYPSLQFSSALQGVIASFSSLFYFYGPQHHCFGSFSLSIYKHFLEDGVDSETSAALHQHNEQTDWCLNKTQATSSYLLFYLTLTPHERLLYHHALFQLKLLENHFTPGSAQYDHSRFTCDYEKVPTFTASWVI